MHSSGDYSAGALSDLFAAADGDGTGKDGFSDSIAE